MSWREIPETQSVSIDAEGRRQGMRVYRVWNYAKTAILNDPASILNEQGFGLPGVGTTWEGMRLDRYDVRPLGKVFDVTGLHSSDRRFAGSPPVDPAHEEFRSRSGSYRTELIEIPWAQYQETKLAVPGPAGQPPTLVDVNGFAFASQMVKHTFQEIIYRVTLAGEDAVQAFQAIEDQHDKLHKINGRWYLFQGGDYNEVAPGKWEFQYQWMRDPGTPQVAPLDSSHVVNVYPPKNKVWPVGSGIEWARPPFYELVISPAESGDPTDPPVFEALLHHDDTDPLGWSTLPGFSP